ncbi:TetR/AcrR family transcriptional regulator [Aquabacterium soli]|uniref:TetR/AcrR family transcriptional regulator n=1 Tax=Aquabacterium soli TaxID=2493092 RepID=A0A3R8TUC4_9BURK|nr:TetR/AcrR family transcriptional regulator [Aquabacterium soli]RRS04945.1 TetR/AcrR family transcriptional regulator [Aquabacterium soli]
MEISKNRVNPSNTPESGAPVAGGGRRYGGVDKDERQRQRRERLVAAALGVFGEQGYHVSTVRDVCRHAELTSRYFYESFEGMEALFEAVYLSVSRELMDKTMGVLQRTPLMPEQLAEAALRTFLEFIREDPRRARVMLIDAFTVGPGIQRISAESNSDFANLIGSFIEMLFPNLDKVGLNPNLISNGLVGSNIRLATMWVEEKCATPLEEMLRNMMAIFTASIEHARKLMSEADAKS